MKPVDVKSSTYIDFDVENSGKDLKFKVSNDVSIIFVVKIVKNTVPWIYTIRDINNWGNVGIEWKKHRKTLQLKMK